MENTRGKIIDINLNHRIEPWGLNITESDKVTLEAAEQGVWVVPTQMPDEPFLVPWSSIHFANARRVPVKPARRARKAGA
jgi:hypothetical protein